MAKLAFYHLTRSSAEEALPLLLQKTLSADKKALVCSPEQKSTQLSTALWSFGEGSWLPHGISGKDDQDAVLCPIWLTDNPEHNANQAEFVFFLNGIEPKFFDDKERVFILFDGHNADAVSEARTYWKSFRDDGHEMSYWQQDDAGRWSQAA